MFRFKHFNIEDEQCAMKVGTDGVLLGAWASVEDDALVLDVGTGTGIIALMVAQRNPNAKVVALDIAPDAVAQARYNIERSKWTNRVECICTDVSEYKSDTKFDHIISNPPYFTEATHSPNRERDMARSVSSMPFEKLVESAERLLRRGGKLSVIMPTESASLFRRVAFERLWLRRICSVRTLENDAPKRVLMEFELCDTPLMPRAEELIVQCCSGEYSADYRALTKDFYLNF